MPDIMWEETTRARVRVRESLGWRKRTRLSMGPPLSASRRRRTWKKKKMKVISNVLAKYTSRHEWPAAVPAGTKSKDVFSVLWTKERETRVGIAECPMRTVRWFGKREKWGEMANVFSFFLWPRCQTKCLTLTQGSVRDTITVGSVRIDFVPPPF